MTKELWNEAFAVVEIIKNNPSAFFIDSKAIDREDINIAFEAIKSARAEAIKSARGFVDLEPVDLPAFVAHQPMPYKGELWGGGGGVAIGNSLKKNTIEESHYSSIDLSVSSGSNSDLEGYDSYNSD
tara:strand:+ start:42 stop:422 length:381 start_codon:yes stop_codon:yes gene_type:complete